MTVWSWVGVVCLALPITPILCFFCAKFSTLGVHMAKEYVENRRVK